MNDQRRRRVGIKREPTKKFDMDCMTMVFGVADQAMLDKEKAGDKIEFEADRVNMPSPWQVSVRVTDC